MGFSMFEKLGKFEIKRVLGNGAMGEVYLGVDPSIGREVAIKTILPASAQGGEAKERFAREARAAGVLNHPNLVTIYEFGEDQGVLYIAMEYVRGHDLDELLQEQSLSRSEALEVLAQVCDGLGFAHRQQIVHRDIKPTNVRVQRDGKRLHAKVMDFGVAKISNSDMTATGMVMGTVSYMAPEYIRTGKPDPRSDLFAVGVMLYECLSGRKPFAGDTTPTVLYKIVNEAPDPIDTEMLQGISPAIRTVMDRALCKNPDERFQTAEELAKALRSAKDPSWVGDLEQATTLMRAAAPTAPVRPSAEATTLQPMAPPPIRAAAAPVASPSPRPRRSGTGLWVGVAALVLAGLGGTSWYLLKGRTAETPLDPAAQATAATPEAPPPGKPDAPPSWTAGKPAVVPPTLNLPPAGSPEAKPGPKGEARTEVPRPEPIRPPVVRNPEPTPQGKPDPFRDDQLEKMEVPARLSLGNSTMSESILLIEKDPDRAILGFRQSLKANPENSTARAWLALVLARQGRTDEFIHEVREGRRRGQLPMMSRNPQFHSILMKARLNRQLPNELAD